MNKRAIVRVSATELVMHPQTRQPLGHREREHVQVFDTDVPLSTVLAWCTAKQVHTASLTFETEVLDTEALNGPKLVK